MKIGVIGTGILGLQTVMEICSKTPDSDVFLIGEKNHPGTATNAAGAMLNSIAEIDNSTFKSKYGRFLLSLCEKATLEWETFNKRYNRVLHADSDFDLITNGTYLLNSSSGDFYEDIDFNRISNYCARKSIPALDVDPKDIPGLFPINHSRSIKALYIPSEGFVDVNLLKETIYLSIFTHK